MDKPSIFDSKVGLRGRVQPVKCDLIEDKRKESFKEEEQFSNAQVRSSINNNRD